MSPLALFEGQPFAAKKSHVLAQGLRLYDICGDVKLAGEAARQARVRQNPKKLRLEGLLIVTNYTAMVFAQAAFTRPEDEESAFRQSFWLKMRNVTVSIPFAEDLLAAYYCAFDRGTPLSVKTALVGALAYFVLPTDVIPDVLPVFGFADDAAVLAATFNLVSSHIRPEHRTAAKNKIAEFSSKR